MSSGLQQPPTSPAPGTDPRLLALVLGIAWIGMLAHDLVEFGRPDAANSLAYLALYVGILLAWTREVWRGPGVRWALLVLAGLSLVGAVTSVLPLPVWPFQPDQGIVHYGVHALWVVTQLPLLGFLLGRGRDLGAVQGASA